MGEALLVAVAVVLVTGVTGMLAVGVRRRLLQRQGGTLELSLRLKPQARGRGWVLGLGRFSGDDLEWYRVFSLAPRPRRTYSRWDLEVVGQRPPRGPETYALLQGAVVVECRTSRGPVHFGAEPGAVTGLLAWLEARPPGAVPPS